MSALVAVSKRLSYVLRHHPESHGLTLDPNGWVAVPVLLAALAEHGRPVSRAELDEVVATNDKRRYELCQRDGTDWIRASQGHSRTVPVDLGLPRATPPAVLWHGTVASAVPSIMESGLRPGRRHHVHLSPDRETARAVGRRRAGAVVLLRVDAAGMAAAGHEFYHSANGVWLTAAVPPEFLDQPSFWITRSEHDSLGN
jgi:putative RNA 2'-phosphotransferase